MKKFDFRLQRVLNYKEKIEEIKRNEYTEAKNLLDEEEKKLQNIVEYKTELLKQKDEKVRQASIADLQFYNNFINNINSRINIQKNLVLEKQEEVSIKRDILVNAVKDKKIIEKLRERDYNDYLYLLNKEEEKLVDQLVSYTNSIK